MRFTGSGLEPGEYRIRPNAIHILILSPIFTVLEKSQIFRYDFSAIENCKNLDDEVCNNGPVVWDELVRTFRKCPKPCLETNYAKSHIEMMNNKYDYSLMNENEAFFYLKVELDQFVLKELLVYDANDMIGSIGGSLGIFIGFSLFGTLSNCFDNLLDLGARFLQKRNQVVVV